MLFYFFKMAVRKRKAAPKRKGKGAKKYSPKKTSTMGLKYTKRGSYNVDGAYKQLQVYAQPFSTLTSNPKIPDGKCGYSAGLRIQAVKECTSASDGIIHIMMYPGANAGFYTFSPNGPDPSEKRIGKYDNFMDYATNFTINTSEEKWRLVSQAMKITMINNSDENDGWFETIRIPMSYDDFQVTTPVGPKLDEAQFLGAVGLNTNLVENSTYVSGKLRDIHRYIFQLNPCANSHDFTQPSAYRSGATELNVASLDDSFDCIYVRVHGRKAFADSQGTRLMIHNVSNHEVVYDAPDPMSRFHSECTRANLLTFENTRLGINKNTKAARATYVQN